MQCAECDRQIVGQRTSTALTVRQGTETVSLCDWGCAVPYACKQVDQGWLIALLEYQRGQ